MSELGDKQKRFTLAIGNLILFAYNQGYTLTFADAYAKTGHMDNSNHYRRLAVDFNLFINDIYITDSHHKSWKVLHDYFLQLGGAPMIKSDAGHFSFLYYGIA